MGLTGLRILVIGNGSIGRRHHGNLVTLGVRAELLPYRALQGGAGIAQLEAAGGRFDGVVIATATQIRTEIVAFCAERGLPFYVEKPLAYRSADLSEIARLAAPLANRSLIGFMMRYHPAIRHLAGLDLSDIYHADFTIGHDVRQWRQNWRFADSYSARPEGGGVLLDLCHELDMAQVLFPGLKLGRVESLGHAAYPGVDFATRVGMAGGPVASVTMDYLSPTSLRRIFLRGQRHTVDFDLIAGRYRLATGGVWADLAMPFDRNDMFLAAMGDFLALVAGDVPKGQAAALPRFDLALGSAALIAAAYEARQFVGQIEGDY